MSFLHLAQIAHQSLHETLKVIVGHYLYNKWWRQSIKGPLIGHILKSSPPRLLTWTLDIDKWRGSRSKNWLIYHILLQTYLELYLMRSYNLCIEAIGAFILEDIAASKSKDISFHNAMQCLPPLPLSSGLPGHALQCKSPGFQFRTAWWALQSQVLNAWGALSPYRTPTIDIQCLFVISPLLRALQTDIPLSLCIKTIGVVGFH